MRTKAVRIYGKRDLRLEEFDLPEMGEDEILAQVVSDSICMSSQGCFTGIGSQEGSKGYKYKSYNDRA